MKNCWPGRKIRLKNRLKTPAHIHIPEPCQVPWDSMQPGTESRFCKSCQMPVVDFSAKTLAEIETFFKAQAPNSKVCGRYKAYHTNEAGKGAKVLRGIEKRTQHTVFKGLALWLISCVLLLSGCIRHVQGRLRAYDDAPSKKPRKHHTRSVSGSLNSGSNQP